MDDFQDALDGKVTTEGWTAEKLVDYHKFLKTATKEAEGQVGGLREAKRSETDRVAKLKEEGDRIDREIAAKKQETPPSNPEMSQFRLEQVSKAKARLYSEVKLTEEEKVVVEEKFKRLDTGKVDADLIYVDLLSAVAASNPTKFFELTKGQQEAQRMADDEIQRQAELAGGAPSGNEPRKFSEEAVALARKAGITPEAATRQVTQGMSRTYE